MSDDQMDERRTRPNHLANRPGATVGGSISGTASGLKSVERICERLTSPPLSASGERFVSGIWVNACFRRISDGVFVCDAIVAPCRIEMKQICAMSLIEAIIFVMYVKKNAKGVHASEYFRLGKNLDRSLSLCGPDLSVGYSFEISTKALLYRQIPGKAFDCASTGSLTHPGGFDRMVL